MNIIYLITPIKELAWHLGEHQGNGQSHQLLENLPKMGDNRIEYLNKLIQITNLYLLFKHNILASIAPNTTLHAHEIGIVSIVRILPTKFKIPLLYTSIKLWRMEL